MLNITLQIGSLYNRDLVAVVTDAPKDYDGFGTFTLREFEYPIDIGGQKTRNHARLALVDKNQLEWQRNRYFSGMHSAIVDEVEDHFSERDLVEVILNRTINKKAQ